MGAATCSCVERQDDREVFNREEGYRRPLQAPTAGTSSSSNQVNGLTESHLLAPQGVPLESCAEENSKAVPLEGAFVEEVPMELRQRLAALEKANASLAKEKATLEGQARHFAQENSQLHSELGTVAKQRELWKTRAVQHHDALQQQQEVLMMQQEALATQGFPSPCSSAASTPRFTPRQGPVPRGSASSAASTPRVTPMQGPAPRGQVAPPQAPECAPEPGSPSAKAGGAPQGKTPREMTSEEHQQATHRAVRALFDLAPDHDLMLEALATITDANGKSSPRQTSTPSEALQTPSSAAGS